MLEQLDEWLRGRDVTAVMGSPSWKGDVAPVDSRQSQKEDAAADEVLLPLGLPLGSTLLFGASTGGGPRAEMCSIRRGGMVVTLGAQMYSVWQEASRCESRETVALRVAPALRLATYEVFDMIGDLSKARVCLVLSGPYEQRWEDLALVRAVPRGCATGRAHQGPEAYGVQLPHGSEVAWLSPWAFFLWSFWDGQLTLSQAVEAVSDDTKVPADALRRCSVELAVQAVRLGLVFLDTHGSGRA